MGRQGRQGRQGRKLMGLRFTQNSDWSQETRRYAGDLVICIGKLQLAYNFPILITTNKLCPGNSSRSTGIAAIGDRGGRISLFFKRQILNRR